MLGVRGRWKSENNFCKDICSKNVSLTKKLQKIGKKTEYGKVSISEFHMK